MDLSIKDLKLVDEIYRTHNVSQAAEAMGLSQPSVSIRLNNLRSHFDDPLFVRTALGMQPTPRANEIIDTVRHALALLEGDLADRQAFDPMASNRCFRICMTDAGQMVVAPRLLDRLHLLAPALTVEIEDLNEESSRLLETGAIDIAMGFTQTMQAGFHQRRLFEEHMICMVGSQHPRIGARLSLKQFLAERHVTVTTHGSAHWKVERALEKQAVKRTIAARIPSFLGLSQIVASTPLIALVPRYLGEILARHGDIKLMRPPVPLPSYDVTLYWHERYHRDPANRWIRTQLVDLFAE